MADLIDVTATLASTPPPSTLKIDYPTVPSPLQASGKTQCHACATPLKEKYQDMPLNPNALLFADDEFVKGDPGLTQPPPYSNPQNAPGATMYSGTQNILSVPGVTTPQQFQTAIGANTLGIGSATGTFVPPPTQAPTPPPVAAVNTKSAMPMGMTNTQALILAIAACTALLLLSFIVGMHGAPRPVDPLLGL